MASKGRPIITCRVSEELHEELLDQIELSNQYRVEEPWTISTFVEVAIAEKIAKMKRGRKLRAPRIPSRHEEDQVSYNVDA